MLLTILTILTMFFGSNIPNPCEQTSKHYPSNLPEACIRYVYETSGSQIPYDELLTILWCESAFNLHHTGDLHLIPLGSSGPAQISWDYNGGELMLAGITREDLYTLEGTLKAIPIIQRKYVFQHYNWNVKYPDWDAYWTYVLTGEGLYDVMLESPRVRWGSWSCKYRFGGEREHEWRDSHLGLTLKQDIQKTVELDLRLWENYKHTSRRLLA